MPEPSFISHSSRDFELEKVPQLNQLFEMNLEPDINHKILVQTGPQFQLIAYDADGNKVREN